VKSEIAFMTSQSAFVMIGKAAASSSNGADSCGMVKVHPLSSIPLMYMRMTIESPS
jgi:hypothetical protein